MRVFLVIVISVFLSIKTVTEAAEACDKISRFERAFNKTDVYANKTEEDFLLAEYHVMCNCERIKKHQEAFELGAVLYNLRVNQFMDTNLTHARDSRCGAIPPPSMRSLPHHKKPPVREYPNAPAERNWCYLHSPIRDQKTCGGCWAFATAAVLEAATTRVRGVRLEFSEQMLIDCDREEEGCDGGWPTSAFGFVQTYGISEQTYAYENKKKACTAMKYKRALMPKAVIEIVEEELNGDEERLKRIINQVGPVAAGVHITPEMMAYGGGVYLNDMCDRKNINHAIVICGFGVDPVAGPYWIVRNSWSKLWGESGYIRIARGRNTCGIASYAMYPKM